MPRRIPQSVINNEKTLSKIPASALPDTGGNVSVSFSEFRLDPVCVRGKFNNHFKDDAHIKAVVSEILGRALPKITSCKFSEIREGGRESSGLHFHSIDGQHQEIVEDVLGEYGYSKQSIEQLLEGGSLFQIVGGFGHTYPARIVCHKIGNVLYPLFLDTNHHIYLNKKFVRESLFYEVCPTYLEGKCSFMPRDCYAFDFLDEKKIEETYGFSMSPV